jgi:hypothetical protein
VFGGSQPGATATRARVPFGSDSVSLTPGTTLPLYIQQRSLRSVDVIRVTAGCRCQRRQCRRAAASMSPIILRWRRRMAAFTVAALPHPHRTRVA